MRTIIKSACGTQIKTPSRARLTKAKINGIEVEISPMIVAIPMDYIIIGVDFIQKNPEIFLKCLGGFMRDKKTIYNFDSLSSTREIIEQNFQKFRELFKKTDNKAV
ncbi:hypothetical protein M153_1715000739 [Pseudoloma neurophilia]|uniref:Uncharacterized protein n=1 Tax=Pseudoloma neurophilia TaxID=146866 RepID=A0A0R0LUX7_9MICR|nr:hypothetical protein M153_1715000739 [Pseudoloma neurophilia]